MSATELMLQKSYVTYDAKIISAWFKPYLVPSVLVICFHGPFVIEGALSR